MVPDQNPVEEELNVLVLGNNPIELGRVFDTLDTVPGKRFLTVIAFDFKSIFARLTKFKPAFIVIDDNIGDVELKRTVKALLKSKRTKEIPITILKNSNYQEAINVGVLNYILKKGLTGESLYRTLKNSVKFQTTQKFLLESYKKRTGQIKRFISPLIRSDFQV